MSNDLIFDGFYLLYNTIVLKAFIFGTLYGLYRSSQRLKGNMKDSSTVIRELEQNSLSIEKILKFPNYEERIMDKPGSRSLPEERGVIEIKDLSFSYARGGAKVLNGINLTILPGQRIALVGYNGAGKTTLIRLLLRLYDPMEGEILYNGVDLSGGESPKVALSRIFYADRPFFILDEPSSAMEKTVILISHRLSTTKMADTTLMLDNGAITESGTHEDLLARDGKYARMFHLQAEKNR